MGRIANAGMRTSRSSEIAMSWNDRRSAAQRPIARSLLLASIALLVVHGAACASRAGRAIEGARHYAAGTEALERRETALAIAELEEAAALVPHASEIRNHLGLAYWSEGRIDDARAAFETALTLDCDNAAARANLARLDLGVDPTMRDAGRGSTDGSIGMDDGGG
jgi:tetratricopeptide (TPR) repeat protein